MELHNKGSANKDRSTQSFLINHVEDGSVCFVPIKLVLIKDSFHLCHCCSFIVEDVIIFDVQKLKSHQTELNVMDVCCWGYILSTNVAVNDFDKWNMNRPGAVMLIITVKHLLVHALLPV